MLTLVDRFDIDEARALALDRPPPNRSPIVLVLVLELVLVLGFFSPTDPPYSRIKDRFYL
jgi:hypothetical protein